MRGVGVPGRVVDVVAAAERARQAVVRHVLPQLRRVDGVHTLA